MDGCPLGVPLSFDSPKTHLLGELISLTSMSLNCGGGKPECPQSKDMLVRLIDQSKLTTGVSVDVVCTCASPGCTPHLVP